MPVISEDWELFEGEEWYAINNVWNKRDFMNGIDYNQTIEIYTDSFPGNTRFDWSWPEVDFVTSYPGLVIGSKPWERSVSTTSSLPVLIENIGDIDLVFDMDWYDSDQFNIAVSVWLANDFDGRELTITDEVMFWLKSPFFSPGGTQSYDGSNNLGIYTVFHEPSWVDNSGANSNTWSYTAVQFELDHNSGALDLDGLLLEMVDNGLISSNRFLRSVEIGAEIHGSTGWWQLNSLDLQIGSELGPSPNPITASLDGSNSNINIDGSTNGFTDFGGEDTYTLLSSLSDDVTIVDNNPSVINLPQGLNITDASFLADGVQFIVNGNTVTLIGNPAEFDFVFGGTPLDPTAGTIQSFEQTAAAFGTSVPSSGQGPNTATAIGPVQADGSVGDATSFASIIGLPRADPDFDYSYF